MNFTGTLDRTARPDKKLAQGLLTIGENPGGEVAGRKQSPCPCIASDQLPIFFRISSSFLPRLDVAGAFLTAL